MQFFSALILCAPCSISHLCCWGVLPCSMHVWPGISLARLVSGSGLVFVAPAVARRLVGCRSAPLVLFCSQSFPQQRGQPWFLPGLYPTQWGLQTHLLTSPISTLAKCTFQQCQSRDTVTFEKTFLPHLRLEYFLTEPHVSGFLVFFFSNCAGETDNRVLIVRMN